MNASEDEIIQQILKAKTTVEGKKVIAVDETSFSGATIGVAGFLLKKALPEAKVNEKGFTFWESEDKQVKSEVNGEVKLVHGSVPVWYDKNDDFIDITHDLDKHYIDTIEILRQTVEAKDPYTRGHSDRVSAYSVLLGKKLALPKKDLITLKIGGLFHDIGKIGIPDSILLKESRLTDDEYAQIKMHPIVGVQILGNSDFFYDCLPIILHHHEKFDGSGYPNRLRGHDIPYLARICSIVDAFDAMTSRRSYRDVIPLEKVVEELKKYSGTQFDPRNFVCLLRYC